MPRASASAARQPTDARSAPLPGPAKPALLLLCCVGTWLSALAGPLRGPSLCDTKTILDHLQFEADNLTKHYELQEPRLPRSEGESHWLPCFTPGPQAANNISVIQAYFQKVKELNVELSHQTNQNQLDVIIKRLHDLRYEDSPEPSISGPSDQYFKKKQFIQAVFREFSKCMNTTYKAFEDKLKAEGKDCARKRQRGLQ
ncbi:PREDICTED: interleukin-31 [Dipodomys ordii]|uniref:Interleukin-31 n=1 Tax=Dipodomys ordii TaxID=10020 RepID=A0A1S3FR70_DIPOR|nr:PREDICTED: interleukin-31 [Dipodomys ordii]